MVLIGRYLPKEVVELADLVIEIKENKHYYNFGVMARVRIER